MVKTTKKSINYSIDQIWDIDPQKKGAVINCPLPFGKAW